MPTATWQGQILAQANDDECEIVEGNVYFPHASLDDSYFEKSAHHTSCPWKGEASYYDVVVDGERNKQAAWYYPQPKQAASQIKGYVAFWKGVEVA